MMNRKLNIFLSFTPFIALIIFLFIIIHFLQIDALAGGSQIALLFATSICCAIALLVYKTKWTTIEKSFSDNIGNVGSAIVILLLIGAISGIWTVSGIVPTLIYYGVQIIHPSFFLISSCIICCIVSLMTGSSWTTIATIGIALMGIGRAQGFPDGWIAGAIISGAYFGDKISPMSDTTVLASSMTNTPLFTHIRYMIITTVPSLSISLLVFLFAGLSHQVNDPSTIGMYTTVLKQTFHISLWLMVVPVITAILIVKKLPAIVVLFSSVILAAVFAYFFQPEILMKVIGGQDLSSITLFKGLISSIYGSTSIHTSNEAINQLLATKGMTGMLNTIWLILCAMCFGGAMTASGMLATITSVLTKLSKTRTSMVASTVLSGLMLNSMVADQYLSIILSSNMFKATFKKKGYESRLLSRTVEDSCTVTSVLVPWNTCGMTQSTVLGVSTLTYLPYCVFNYISPLMSIIIAAIGYKIYRKAV